jgi:hypothetical protein
MLTITRSQLVQLFLNPEVSGINGSSFIGIDTLTEVDLAGGKANPMQSKVQKCTVGSNVMVFSNKNSNAYENMVRRRLIAEGKNPDNFELGPRKWGVRISNTPLVEHKGSYYLEVIFLKCGAVSYLHDGKPIRKDLIEGLPVESPKGAQGGLSNKIPINTYKIASIVRITINNDVYIVID